MGFRLSDEEGGPLRIAAQPTAGPEPEPTETAPAIPDGFEEVSLTFGTNCPARVSILVPDGWRKPDGAGSVFLYPEPAEINGPQISVSCYETFTQSPSESVNSTQRYLFEDETEVLAQRKGQLGAGYVWIYEADLAENEIRYAGEPTRLYGVQVAYPINGKTYAVDFTSTTPTADAETVEALSVVASHITVEGQEVVAPDFTATS